MKIEVKNKSQGMKRDKKGRFVKGSKSLGWRKKTHYDLINCTICNKEIPRTASNKKYCDECLIKKRKEWDRVNSRKYRANNKEQRKITCKDYEKNNPEKVKKSRKKAKDKKRFGGNRIKALKRDNFKCQICKKGSPKKLHVHHIDGNGWKRGVGYHKDMNNNLNNLITLCPECHKTIGLLAKRIDYYKELLQYAKLLKGGN